MRKAQLGKSPYPHEYGDVNPLSYSHLIHQQHNVLHPLSRLHIHTPLNDQDVLYLINEWHENHDDTPLNNESDLEVK